MKKIIQSIVIIFMTLALLFLTGGCAKKGLKTESEVVPAAKVPQAGMAAGEDEAARMRSEAEEAARKRAMEEERARLREREQMFSQEIRDFESENIYFDFDRSELKPAARAILDKKAAWLNGRPEYSLRIEGHCDERGTNAYNLALGERRAAVAKKYLVAKGVSEKRIDTLSYGEERPADPGHDERAWSKNRRDEFKLVK